MIDSRHYNFEWRQTEPYNRLVHIQTHLTKITNACEKAIKVYLSGSY